MVAPIIDFNVKIKLPSIDSDVKSKIKEREMHIKCLGIEMNIRMKCTIGSSINHWEKKRCHYHKKINCSKSNYSSMMWKT